MMRGSKWTMVVMMEMVLILVIVMMQRPPPTPRRRGDGDGDDSPFSAAPEQQDLTPLEGGRGFATAAAPINLGKN
jgi:hypothetical protein